MKGSLLPPHDREDPGGGGPPLREREALMAKSRCCAQLASKGERHRGPDNEATSSWQDQ
jgi:hypothetical protein